MATDDTPGTNCTVAATLGPPLEDWMYAPTPASNSAAFDPAVAHPARVYAYWLGGKDYYEADRQAAEEVIRVRPQVVASARANRAYLARVVRFLAADAGIRQFLDVGAGLPAPEATHQVAQSVDPACRVVYADTDRSLPGSVHAVGSATWEDEPGEPSSGGVREGQHGKPG